MAAPNAGPDESLANIQRFIAVLTATIEQVHAHAATLDEQADAVEDQDGEAQDAAADLADALTDFEAGVERGEHDALDEMQALRESARQGAEERMARAQGEVESARGDFDDVLDDGSARIEEAHTGLGDDGFDPLARTMEALESALAQDQQEAVAAFDGLEAALGEQEVRVGAAFGDAGAGMDEAAEESRGQDLAIGGDVNDGISALEAVASGIDASCGREAVALEHLYEAWRETVRVEANDLITGTTGFMQDTTDVIETLTDGELVEPVEGMVTALFVPHFAEVSRLLQYVEDARQVASGELPLLVADLEKALGVVQTIGELLAALE